jgi:Secretion system C-terminal sorting domain
MIRKFTFLFLLSLGSVFCSWAQDSVTITIPPYSDTTCIGTSITFTAHPSDTSIAAAFSWYVNGIFDTVADSFTSASIASGDSVYCKMYYVTSAGSLDSALSNVIYIYHSATVPPGVVISVTAGSNPTCPGSPVTFTAVPYNGGASPGFQWYINGSTATGDTGMSFTSIFDRADTVYCIMTSTSACASTATATSNAVVVTQIQFPMSASIAASANPVCYLAPVTFTATLINPGTVDTFSWFVNGLPVFSSYTDNTYTVDTLSAGDIVFCMVSTSDSCISDPVTYSNEIIMSVTPAHKTMAMDSIIAGANPGCLDSPVTFAVSFSNFGVLPNYGWYVNGTLVASDTPEFSSIFSNGDIVTFEISVTDTGCYFPDSIITAPITLTRDTAGVSPLISLIGDQLVAHDFGTYQWYYGSSDTGTFTAISGATGQVYHPTELGYYYAKLITSACPSLPSNILYLALLDVNKVSKTEMSVYPNPAYGNVNVSWGNIAVRGNIAVYNTGGQVVLYQEVVNAERATLATAHLPGGDYFVVIHYGDGTQSTAKVTIVR